MTPTQKEVEAMKKVMSNLSSITDHRPPSGDERSSQVTSTKFKDPNSQAMLDILTRLSTVNEQTRTVIAENSDIRTKQLASTEETSTGVKIANYVVNIAEHDTGHGVRNTYSIYDTTTHQEIYSDLALYESVMAITKQLLKSGSVAFIKCNAIAKLDADYAKNLYEAMAYKQRIKATQDYDRKCLYENKYSRNIGLAKEAKRNILKSY